jgi:hypothetical protein
MICWNFIPFSFVDKYKHFATVFKVEAVYISSVLKMEAAGSSEILPFTTLPA